MSRIQRPPLAAAILMAMSAHSIAADSTPKTFTLDKVTVAATLSEQKLEDVANTVSVIDAEQVGKQGATDIRDLMRYETGVEVGSDPRFGLSGFNIRGMDENRVKIVVDGVDQAKAFNPGGGFQEIKRNNFDIEALKQVEVVKGPASTLYGSALGGVVSFTTKDPSDFLSAEGNDTHAGIKGAYNSAGDNKATTLTVANRTANVESLLIYTRRNSEETETQGNSGGTGDTRTIANPADNQANNVLAKVSLSVNENHTIGLTGEFNNSKSESRLYSKDQYNDYSSYFGPGQYLAYENSSTKDEYTRTRIGFNHQWQANTPLFDSLDWQLNWQETESRQINSEIVDSSPMVERMFHLTNGDRVKDYSHTEESIQLQATFAKTLGINQLTYGFKYEDASMENETTTITAGTVTDQGRYVPVVNSTNYGLFIQDQISLYDGQLVITPGISYDSFETNPTTDSRWSEVLKDHSNSKASVRLGGVYKFSDTYSAFAQYSQGFKSPDIMELYYTRDGGSYITLPNENLEPEESDSYELGFRANGDLGNFELVGFYNDYTNFIETVKGSNPNYPQYGDDVSQAQNIAEAVIKGVELRTSIWLDQAVGAPTGTSLHASIAFADGQGQQDGGVDAPLNEVAPLKAVIGVNYDNPNGQWGGSLTTTLVDGKDTSDIDGENLFATPGYGLIDVAAYYAVNDKLELRAGLYNLTDRKYWAWEDVRGKEADNASLDRYTETGRNFSVSANYTF